MLRGVLALAVVVWHFSLYDNHAPAFMSIPGRTAVWIFFGISGYVISYGFFSGRYGFSVKDLKAFYLNRFLRIFPLFFLLTLLGYVSALASTGRSPLRWSDIPAQVFMLQFDHDYSLNGVFWTLGIEVQYYLIAPLLAAFFLVPLKHSIVVYAAVYLVLLCWIPLMYFSGIKHFDARNLVFNLSHFFAGMAACKYARGRKKIGINPLVSGAAIIALLIITNELYRYHIRYYWSAGTFCVDLIVVFAVLLHTAIARQQIRNSAPLKALSFLGLISYGIYAWHSYLETYVPVANLLLAVLLTVAVASVSYYLVEKPALSLKSIRKKTDEEW